MNLEAIRWIDKNIGRPFCFLLTLHRRFCDIFRKSIAGYEKPSKILFIKLIEQGSTVLTYPALKKAIDLAGKENVYFLVFKDNRPILDILNVISSSNIIEVDSEGICKFIYSAVRALTRIRKEHIDTVIDMEFFARASAILSYLSGANKRVGLHQFSCEGPYRGNLFTHKLIYNPYLHTRVFFASLVEALNHKPPAENTPLIFKIPKIAETYPRFSPTEDEKNSLIKRIEQLKQFPLSKPAIILNPNIGDLLPIRRWPEESFIALGKMFLREFPRATIIITGTPQEKEKADKIASQIGNAVSLAGHTSLRELLTLYYIADVLVTSDSGPAHFATLTPIKAIILFGPEAPILYGEQGKNTETVYTNFVCSPCISVYNQRKSPCTNAVCLKTIKAEDIFGKIKGVLEKKI